MIQTQQELMDKYPKLFGQKNWSIMESCMPWGIECGKGWYDIIDNACGIIQHYIDSERSMRSISLRYNRALKRAIAGDKQYLYNFYKNIYKEESEIQKRVDEEIKRGQFREVGDKIIQIQFTQVKEKFGGLRLYTNYSCDYIDGVISMAMSMSQSTCETCGKPGKRRGGGWIYTACDEHTDKKDLEEDEQDDNKDNQG